MLDKRQKCCSYSSYLPGTSETLPRHGSFWVTGRYRYIVAIHPGRWRLNLEGTQEILTLVYCCIGNTPSKLQNVVSAKSSYWVPCTVCVCIRMPQERSVGSRSTWRLTGCSPQQTSPTDESGLSARRAKFRTSRETRRRSPMYDNPTSSFAGGRHGTQIFAAVSGGSDGLGDSLLRAYHDAVVQPLLKRGGRSAARHSSSSPGTYSARENRKSREIVHGELFEVLVLQHDVTTPC